MIGEYPWILRWPVTIFNPTQFFDPYRRFFDPHMITVFFDPYGLLTLLWSLPTADSSLILTDCWLLWSLLTADSSLILTDCWLLWSWSLLTSLILMDCWLFVDRLQLEILVCIADEQDPAIALVSKLHGRHPNVDCRMFIGGKDGILNPLVHNMTPAYEAAKYDVVWVSTSRIQGTISSYSFAIIISVAYQDINRLVLVLRHSLSFET